MLPTPHSVLHLFHSLHSPWLSEVILHIVHCLLWLLLEMEPCPSVFLLNSQSEPNTKFTGSTTNKRVGSSFKNQEKRFFFFWALSQFVSAFFICYLISCSDFGSRADPYRCPESQPHDLACRPCTPNLKCPCVCDQGWRVRGTDGWESALGRLGGTEGFSEPPVHAPLLHWTSLTKYRSKYKIINNLNMVTTEH